MGNIFSKKKRQTPVQFSPEIELESFVDEKPFYRKLTVEQKKNLEMYFHNIIGKAAIDFDNSEIKDIKYAVFNLLKMIADKVKVRGIFNISEIESCGSMAEKTSLWKWDTVRNSTYTEFDFLCVLNDSSENNYKDICSGCSKVNTSPVDLTCLQNYYSSTDESLITHINEPKNIVELFQREIASCLTSSCSCPAFEYTEGSSCSASPTRTTSLQHTSSCSRLLSIQMPTGTLSVNTSIRTEKCSGSPANCTLILLWTSKYCSFRVPHGYDLQKTDACRSIPIYVDFIPALKYTQSGLSGSEYENKSFLVSKPCSRRCHTEGWRKSSCLSEIKYMLKSMSNKHRRCYQIMKYLIQLTPYYTSSCLYHVKMTAFHHDKICCDSSENCVDCTLKMLCELMECYKSKNLKSLDLEEDLLNSLFDTDNKLSAAYFEEVINRLCSISEKSSWHRYAAELRKTYKPYLSLPRFE